MCTINYQPRNVPTYRRITLPSKHTCYWSTCAERAAQHPHCPCLSPSRSPSLPVTSAHLKQHLETAPSPNIYLSHQIYQGTYGSNHSLTSKGNCVCKKPAGWYFTEIERQHRIKQNKSDLNHGTTTTLFQFLNKGCGFRRRPTHGVGSWDTTRSPSLLSRMSPSWKVPLAVLQTSIWFKDSNMILLSFHDPGDPN